MRELSLEETALVSGGLDFDNRPVSKNVEFRPTLDDYVYKYGAVQGPILWVAHVTGVL